jgi:hypothetical protein
MNTEKPTEEDDESGEQYELPLEDEGKELDFDRTPARQWEETFETDFEEELDDLEDLDTELIPLEDEDLGLLEADKEYRDWLKEHKE